jgi:hypothetical protein
MSITIPCPHCASTLEVAETLSGQTAKCSGCEGLVIVPGSPPHAAAVGGSAAATGQPHFHCPYCGSGKLPVVRKKVSTAGWAVFIALLFICFLFCPFALFITEDRRYCRDCGIGLG